MLKLSAKKILCGVCKVHVDIIVLNSKDRKGIKQQLEGQFGVTNLPDKVFFCLNKKERVYLTNRQTFDVDQQTLRVNAFGLYFGTFMKDGFRLSLEGAQMLKSQIKTGNINITLEERNILLKGQDLEPEDDTPLKKTLDELNGAYVIFKHESDIIGCGKVKNSIALNYIPKSKQLKRVFPEE